MKIQKLWFIPTVVQTVLMLYVENVCAISSHRVSKRAGVFLSVLITGVGLQKFSTIPLWKINMD